MENLLDIEDKKQTEESVLGLASEVVAAYVSNNSVSADEVPELLYQVYRTLTHLKQQRMPGAGGMLEPAVPINESVTDDYLVCLEDGKRLKMLKRHLKAAYDLTPDQYRERWGLPVDYPMVAPNYAKKRSTLAKLNGLGQTAHQRSVGNAGYM